MPALDFLVQRVYFRRAVLVVATLVAVGLYIDTRWNPDTTWSRVRDAQHSFELADRADSVHAASNKSSSDVQETPRVNDVCMDRVRPEQDLQLPPLDAPVVLYEWAMFEPPVILNQDVFGTVQQNPVRYLIVIRVHDRLRYLRALLRSLERVRGVESALLVLSHDVVDEELLEAARSVCYCRVLRVFFPYSRQIWPDQFPGPDDPGPSTAEERVGKSSQRNASFTMAKHHWWWMHNKVFTDVYSLTNFSGTTLFLEEDMIVSPDILHVLDVMQAKEKADIFVLNDNNGWLDSTRGNKAVLTHWVYNMGVALGPATWAKIVRCAEFFCSYDDYNHDWSLQALGARCVPGQLTVLVMTGSRVFHVGKCGGMHFGATSDCDALQRAVSATLDAAERAGVLFPETLSVTRSLARTVVSRPNGGWSDPRDHQLCMDVANASIVRWGSTPGTSTPSRSPRRIPGKGPAA